MKDDGIRYRYVASDKAPEWWLQSLEADVGPINVVSQEKAEQADLVVCVFADAEPVFFDDDIFTVCADCGRAIRHRPHAPKKPPKVCINCALQRLEQENHHGDV